MWGEERGIPTIKKRNAWRKKGVAARGKDTTEKKHPKRDFRATKMECLRKNSDIKKKMSLKKKKKRKIFQAKKDNSKSSNSNNEGYERREKSL